MEYQNSISIVAVGEAAEAHTIVIDNLWIYHVSGGEKLTISCVQDPHSLLWLAPQKFLKAQVKIDPSRDMCFKIEKKKTFLGTGAFAIRECMEQELEGCFSSERTAEPWQPGIDRIDFNNHVGVAVYPDGIVIADARDQREEISFKDIMKVDRDGLSTLVYPWEEPFTHVKKLPIRFEDRTMDLIKRKDTELFVNQGYQQPPHGIDKYGAYIEYQDKLVLINSKDEVTELPYENLFFARKAKLTGYLVTYDWEQPWSTKREYPFALPDGRIKSINSHIDHIQKCRTAVVKDKLFIKHPYSLHAAILFYDENGIQTEIKPKNLEKLYEDNRVTTLKYYVDDSKSQLKSFSAELPSEVVSELKGWLSIYKGVEYPSKTFQSPTDEKVKLEFYKDAIEICLPDKPGQRYPFKSLIRYEIKEFDNSSSPLASMLVMSAASARDNRAVSGMLYAQQLKQKLSRIEIWLTFKSDKTVVKQVDFIHPVVSFERSGERYKEYQSAVLKLTSYLDDIIQKNQEKAVQENKPKSSSAESKQKASKTPQDPVASADDNLALLKKLAELKDAGILSEEEFKKKKTEILSRI